MECIESESMLPPGPGICTDCGHVIRLPEASDLATPIFEPDYADLAQQEESLELDPDTAEAIAGIVTAMTQWWNETLKPGLEALVEPLKPLAPYTSLGLNPMERTIGPKPRTFKGLLAEIESRPLGQVWIAYDPASSDDVSIDQSSVHDETPEAISTPLSQSPDEHRAAKVRSHLDAITEERDKLLKQNEHYERLLIGAERFLQTYLLRLGYGSKRLMVADWLDAYNETGLPR